MILAVHFLILSSVRHSWEDIQSWVGHPLKIRSANASILLLSSRQVPHVLQKDLLTTHL